MNMLSNSVPERGCGGFETYSKQTYIPGFYMLLEFSGGGDIFDKSGMLTCISRKGTYQELLSRLGEQFLV